MKDGYGDPHEANGAGHFNACRVGRGAEACDRALSHKPGYDSVAETRYSARRPQHQFVWRRVRCWQRDRSAYCAARFLDVDRCGWLRSGLSEFISVF